MFTLCSSLKTVSLPEGLLGIAINAFYNTAITEIKLPSTLKSLGRSSLPFSNIKVLELPDNIESIWYISCEAVFVTENSKTHKLFADDAGIWSISPPEMKILFKQTK